MDFEGGSALCASLLDFEAGRSFLPLTLSSTLLPISSNFNQSTNLAAISSKFISRGDSKFDVGSTLSPHSVSSAGLPPSDFSTPFEFEKSFAPFQPGGKPLDQFDKTVSSFGEISRPIAASNTRHVPVLQNAGTNLQNAPILQNAFQPSFPRPFLGQASGRESSLSSSSLNNLEDVMEDTTVVYVSGADLDDSTTREGLHFGLQLCQGACCPGRVKFAWMVEEDFDSRGRVGSVSSDGYSTPGSSRDGIIPPGSSGNSSGSSREGVITSGSSGNTSGSSREGMFAPGITRNGMAAPSMVYGTSSMPSMDGVSNQKQVSPSYRPGPRQEFIRKDNTTIIIPSAMPGLVPKSPPKMAVESSGFYSSPDTQIPPPAPLAVSPPEKSSIEDENEAPSEAKTGNPNKWAKIKRKNKKGKK